MSEQDKGELTVREAGRRGGRRTAERYPIEFFIENGKKGGTVCKERHGHEHYVRSGRKGGETTSARHGSEFYQQIGKKGGKRVRELIAKAREMEEEEEA